MGIQNEKIRSDGLGIQNEEEGSTRRRAFLLTAADRVCCGESVRELRPSRCHASDRLDGETSDSGLLMPMREVERQTASQVKDTVIVAAVGPQGTASITRILLGRRQQIVPWYRAFALAAEIRHAVVAGV